MYGIKIILQAWHSMTCPQPIEIVFREPQHKQINMNTLNRFSMLLGMVIMISFMSFSCTQKPNAQQSEYKALEVNDFLTLLKKTPNAQLVDVRTPEEYAEGHIDGSINIDFKNRNFPEMITQKLDPKKPTFIYCRSGNRSRKSSYIFKDKGFKNIIDLKGGYKAYVASR